MPVARGARTSTTPPRSQCKDTSPSQASTPTAGVDVGFDDGRFLRRVLQEAQRGGQTDAVRKLEVHGFSAEVAKIALHVSGGDERRALELCMSGMAFTGADGGDYLSPEKICPPPAPLNCYICGGRHLTQRSLEIHLKACRRRFEQREAKRAPAQRRPLLEESDLPEGIATLEEYYSLAGKPGPGEDEQPEADGSGRANAVITKQRQQQEANADVLLPCSYCKRTFASDRLQKHELVCIQRPKYAEASPLPISKRGGGGGRGTGERAYEAFCQSLVRCPGCARQFRPEVLENHAKSCAAAAAADRTPPAHAVGSRTPPHRFGGTPPASGSSSAPSRRRSFGGPPPASSGSYTPKTPTTRKTQAAAYTPPQRRVASQPPTARPKAAVAARPTAAAAAAAAAPQPGDEAWQSAGALMERGFLEAAPEAEEATLRAQVAGHVPGAEFIGAYKVANCAQHGVYDALKAGVQAKDPSGPPEERDLWHGTSWAILAKILRHGFNRSFAGRHGTLLGVATYFSTDLSYSQRFCDRRGGGKDGTKAVLLSRVLVGRYCKGSPSDVEPPILDMCSGERYDSTVDNVDHPSIFAVFRDFQAVPLYLVEFRCTPPPAAT